MTPLVLPASVVNNVGQVYAYSRVVDWEDTDVAVADTTASIDIGDALPAGAVIIGVTADVTEDFSDGGSGTFDADVGISGGDDDAYTPTQLAIDGGVAFLGANAPQFTPAGGVQLAITLVSSVNLDTLTGGTANITVYWIQPNVTTVAAP